eukprot:12903864-Prorocentrum_lima.AAC.1
MGYGLHERIRPTHHWQDTEEPAPPPPGLWPPEQQSTPVHSLPAMGTSSTTPQVRADQLLKVPFPYPGRELAGAIRWASRGKAACAASSLPG